MIPQPDSRIREPHVWNYIFSDYIFNMFHSGIMTLAFENNHNICCFLFTLSSHCEFFGFAKCSFTYFSALCGFMVDDHDYYAYFLHILSRMNDKLWFFFSNFYHSFWIRQVQVRQSPCALFGQLFIDGMSVSLEKSLE